MKTVYVVSHVIYDYEQDYDEGKFIGVFTTKELAQSKVAEMKLLPGFKDFPDSFIIDETELDTSNWNEGFHTVHYNRGFVTPDRDKG